MVPNSSGLRSQSACSPHDLRSPPLRSRGRLGFRGENGSRSTEVGRPGFAGRFQVAGGAYVGTPGA